MKTSTSGQRTTRSLISVTTPIPSTTKTMLIVGTPEHRRIFDHHNGTMRIYDTPYQPGIIRYLGEIGIPMKGSGVPSMTGTNKFGVVQYAVKIGRSKLRGLISTLSGEYLGYVLPESKAINIVMTSYTSVNVPAHEDNEPLVAGTSAVTHILTYENLYGRYQYAVDGMDILRCVFNRMTQQQTVMVNVVNYMEYRKKDLNSAFDSSNVVQYALSPVLPNLSDSIDRAFQWGQTYLEYTTAPNVVDSIFKALYSRVFNGRTSVDVLPVDERGDLDAWNTVIIHS